VGKCGEKRRRKINVKNRKQKTRGLETYQIEGKKETNRHKEKIVRRER
jgi:hypothetical protein